MKDHIEFVQKVLNERGRNAGLEDGIFGSKTRTALNTVIGLPKSWNKDRKVIGCIQLLAGEQELDYGKFDGYLRPQTDHAFETLTQIQKTGKPPKLWRANEKLVAKPTNENNPNNWPTEKESELIKYYGEVGQNQTYLNLPYPHVLAWNTKQVVKRFSCHEKVHDSLLRVLTKVFNYYGQEEIEKLGLNLFGGCLNVRKIRGGNRYSTHSWGIAVDYDPARNQLRWGKDKAHFAKQQYDPWWNFWEEEGWVSLGRLKNYDWMHVQAAKR